MKLAFVRILGLAMVAVTFSACSSSVTVTDPYQRAWYDVYGNYCGSGHPTAGCNFYADGSKIRMGEDPYYNHNGVTMYYDFWTYTDSYGYTRDYLGYAWLSSSGILYDDYGNALNEMDETQASADAIAEAAAKEKQVAAAVGKALAQKYALAEDKGVMISKTLQDWAQLGRERARTDADVADISKRLYGVDANKAKNAIQQALASQSQQPIEELNVDVAAHWGTSPEVSKQILKNWYKEEVAAYGVK